METIIARNDNIHQIVAAEIKRLGYDADLNHIDVTNVTNMAFMFDNAKIERPESWILKEEVNK